MVVLMCHPRKGSDVVKLSCKATTAGTAKDAQTLQIDDRQSHKAQNVDQCSEIRKSFKSGGDCRARKCPTAKGNLSIASKCLRTSIIDAFISNSYVAH